MNSTAISALPEPFSETLIGPLIRPEWRIARYAVAILLVCAIGALRLALAPVMGTEAPVLPFILAVIAAASLGGTGPAILATCLVPVMATVLFTRWPNGNHVVAWTAHLAFFVAVSALVILAVSRLQRAAREQRAVIEAARRLADQATRTAAQLRLIADAIPALISYVDKEERYQFVNRGYEHWFGVKPADIAGTPVREVVGDVAYDTVRGHLKAALRGIPVRYEALMPYPTGERFVAAHLVPDRGPDNAIRGVVTLIEDITEIKKSERTLRDQERMLKLIYDNASDCLYLVAVEGDESFRFVSVNRTFLEVSGYERDQVEGHLIEKVIPPANQALVREQYRSAIQSRSPVVYTETSDLPAGRRHGEITLIPIADENGSITHILGAIKDVTERKAAEDALLDADRRKDEFLAMLAHELRNPLAPIRNVAHLLRNENLDAGTVRRNSELLQRQATQLARLVDDLLDVARITRGAIELKREPVSLQRVIDAAIETVQPLFDLKHQTVNTAGAATELFVDGDPARMSQIFGNLLTNAAKYSSEHSLIEVQIEATPDEAVVRVHDDGVGIDAALLPRVFDLFIQGDRSLDRSQGGIGVGLTIVKSLVEQHGGAVEAHSAGPGRGSEFVVRLPRLPTETAGSSVEPAQLPLLTARRILIVDDNNDASESLALLVASVGHETRTAHDGKSALARLEHFDAEIVLLDIGLPGADGYSVARTIRERYPHRRLRLYALTGYGRPEDRARALAAGFDGHLTKPIDPDRLLDLLGA